MTRLIERWFPCKEVSENSRSGWGSGNAEKELFPWFASRPLVQAKAAVICSLLPWPDESSEQIRLQNLVRRAMQGYDSAHGEIVAELAKYYRDGASLIDLFSGRGIIPLEATRLGIKTWGIDYSPVATLAGTLLVDYPMRDWSQEPALPFDDYEYNSIDRVTSSRLLYDVEFVLDLIGRRYEAEMSIFYPKINDKRPWGYLWAITLPCVSCGRRFPLTGNLELRKPQPKRNDPGQSYYIETDQANNDFSVVVHEGAPRYHPTLVKRDKSKGRVAVCPFCEQPHSHEVHTRLRGDGKAKDRLLVVADIDKQFGKIYRQPAAIEYKSIADATVAIKLETPFGTGIPAIPSEKALGSTGPRDYARYGYYTYGDFCNARQTLGFVRLSRIINDMSKKLLKAGVSVDYVATLSGYAGSVLARRLRMSTRGNTLQVNTQKNSTIFGSGPPVPFGSDYLEVGCGLGPGTWKSLTRGTIRTLRKQLQRESSNPVYIQQGTATELPITDSYVDAVVTDPPYDAMVEYSDASDIFYVWLKRALLVSHPEFGITANPAGVQDKTEEAVVKMTWSRSNDHRTPDHYDRSIIKALAEARRVIKSDGVVTIMFGHDNPDVWKRFLTSIDKAGLVLTGSWPARTEKGKVLNKAHIETTLTLACRTMPEKRPEGRMLEVDAQVRKEILDRIPLWQASGLAFSDQRMAAYGPAMEVVGRYSEIRDKSGKPVGLEKYLAKARRYVEEAADIKIGDTSLENFDLRSQFGLFWVYMYGRSIVPGSEARWLRLGWDMTVDDTKGLLTKDKQGFRFIYAEEGKLLTEPKRTIIDVALAVAVAGKSSRDIATILVAVDRVNDDFLWDSMSHLAKHLSERDRDGDVWTWAVRNRTAISGFLQDIEENEFREQQSREDAGVQQEML